MIYPIASDLTFKNLFGTSKNKKFAIDLVECLLNKPKGSINDLKILNNATITPRNIYLKTYEMDILLELENGDLINLESYITFSEVKAIKSLMYLAGIFSSLGRGVKYTDSKTITQYNFLKKASIGKNVLLEGCITLKDDNELIEYLKRYFQISIINLENVVKEDYNKNKRLKKWIRVINAETYKEMVKYAKGDELIMEAVRENKRFCSRKYVDDYFNKENLHESEKILARNEGEAKGRNERNFEIAKSLINQNVDINIIMAATNLPKEQVLSLKI